jgi:GTP1/Obg family GTP-binding protein
MNPIEKQAYLAMKHVSNLIIYVFDLTLTYPIKDQVKLYKRVLDFGLPMIVYFSKNDLIDEKEILDFSKKYKDSCHTVEALAKKLNDELNRFEKENHFEKEKDLDSDK